MAQNVEWVLQRLGYVAAIPARTRQTPVRSTGLYVVLSIITLGLFTIWWRAALMREGNDHFDEDDAVENAILRGMGIAGPAMAVPPPPMAPGIP